MPQMVCMGRIALFDQVRLPFAIEGRFVLPVQMMPPADLHTQIPSTFKALQAGYELPYNSNSNALSCLV